MIYTGNKDTSSIKSKYRKLEYFSDFKIVTQHNFSSELKESIDQNELDYLHNNFQIFKNIVIGMHV